MFLSLSGILFEDGASQSIDFRSFCKLASKACYNGVELRQSQLSVEDSMLKRSEIRKIVDAHGLSVTCIITGGPVINANKRDREFCEYIDFCNDLGCRLLKIKLSSDPKWLRWAAQQAQQSNIAIASNNHIGTSLETIEGTRRHLSAVGHQNYGLLYDSFHLSLKCQDYLGCIPEFIAATRNILMHSLRQVVVGEKADIECDGKGWIKDLPGATGVQRWNEIFRLFKKLGYNGLVTVTESGWPKNKRIYVARICADYLYRLWNEV